MKHPRTGGIAAFLASFSVMLTAAGCGSSGGRSNPPRPTVVITADSQLVDVGDRYRLDASASVDPDGSGLDFFWTLLAPSNSQTAFDDHCEDDPDLVCTSNFDACSSDVATLCVTNADCPEGDVCTENLAESSPDCPSGRCDIGGGRSQPVATFVADVPGPYTARVLVESSRANDIGSIAVDTYPSLYVLGSLFAFGGTGGALLDEIEDAATFAAGAVAAVSSPLTGNLLLAVPGPPGRVREIDYRTGKDQGRFGETADFVTSPIALAFDDSSRLFVAEGDGTVTTFDAEEGRFINVLGDVTSGTEEISTIVFSPLTGELLVVDGRAGEAVRRYDANSGMFLGTFGTIETVATQAVDLAFFGAPPTEVFVADAGGELVRCAADGTACGVVGAASGLLSAGGPSAVVVNPAAGATDNEILVADAVGGAVIACRADGASCAVFGDTQGLASSYRDLVFAPPAVPEVPPPPMVTTTTGL